MKQLSTRTITIVISFIALALLALGVFVTQKDKEAPLPLPIPENPENSENQMGPEETITETIDMSEWKIYRNEEYGFEFELPKEYFLPENDKNVIRKQDTINILDPNKDIYTFNSKKGLEIVKEFGGLGDATDYWMVKVDIHEYADTFSTDFKQWIFDTYNADETAVQDMGSVDVGGREIPYFCWVSFLGDDCSVYFTDKNSVVGIKAWDKVSDAEKINFSYAILQTFHYR